MSELPIGPQPPFFERNLFNWLPAASIDKKPVNSSFGDVLEQVYPVYRQVGHALPALWRPSGLCTRPSLSHSKDAGFIFELVFQGDVVSVTFVAGNPRNSGDIVRPNPSVFLYLSLSVLSNLFGLVIRYREIKLLLPWRFMTTEQTPGRSSTLMHHGRPGKLVCSVCLC